ncbi:hypothetical protein JI58_08040 [Marinosulfonomonas sp. PRT-SC04]|nr:hypothetical protein JI58_08040 [Marinosulfonomonas sp. PRT-SC04]
MGDEFSSSWVVGTSVSVGMAVLGLLIAAFRNTSTKLAGLHRKIDSHAEKHAAENKDIREKYVRRDDLTKELGHIEKSISELKQTAKENQTVVLAAIKESN